MSPHSCLSAGFTSKAHCSSGTLLGFPSSSMRMQLTTRCRNPGPQGVEHYERETQNNASHLFYSRNEITTDFTTTSYNFKKCSYRWPLCLNFPVRLAKDLVAGSSELDIIRELTWITFRGRYFVVMLKAFPLVTLQFPCLYTTTTGFGTRCPIGYQPSKLSTECTQALY